MLNCKEFVAQQNNRLSGAPLSFGQHMSLKIHYFICHHCRRYFKQIRLIESVAPSLDTATPEEQTVTQMVSHLKSATQTSDPDIKQ